MKEQIEEDWIEGRNWKDWLHESQSGNRKLCIVIFLEKGFMNIFKKKTSVSCNQKSLTISTESQLSWGVSLEWE